MFVENECLDISLSIKSNTSLIIISHMQLLIFDGNFLPFLHKNFEIFSNLYARNIYTSNRSRALTKLKLSKYQS